jgi:hypothetical protein
MALVLKFAAEFMNLVSLITSAGVFYVYFIIAIIDKVLIYDAMFHIVGLSVRLNERVLPDEGHRILLNFPPRDLFQDPINIIGEVSDRLHCLLLVLEKLFGRLLLFEICPFLRF